MPMKTHIEKIYHKKELAEKHGKEFQEYFGYTYKIVTEKSMRGILRYRLILDNPAAGTMMG
jgi:hypothetical protein